MLLRSSRAIRCFTCVRIHAQIAVVQVTYASDKTVILTPKDPQFEPLAGLKMVQVLGSLMYNCGSH